MAGRTSAGVGMIVSMTIFALATVALFVTTILFLARYQRAERELAELNREQAEFIAPDERQNDQVRALLQQAKENRQSLVAFLRGSLQQTVTRVTGAPRDGVADMNAKLERVEGAGTAPLLSVIQQRDATIAALRRDVQQASEARDRAEADLLNEVNARRAADETHQRTLAANADQLAQYRQEVDQYRQGTEDLRGVMDAQVERIRAAAADEAATLRNELARASTDVQVLREQLEVFRTEKKKDLLSGTAEFALVDGDVIGVDQGSGRVFIGLGRDQKIALGMTFAVYGGAAAIRPDDQGVYPRGKAALEVISVGDSTSTCRIVPGSEIRGDPVVKGDVIANAVYDPRKVYKFVVDGNFDTDRDGQATEAEKATIEALIHGWGGAVIPELAGDVDFLVLGERPVLPPRPAPDAPIAVIQNYIEINRRVTRYDELFAQASTTSLPVLNHNRLFTLIGAR